MVRIVPVADSNCVEEAVRLLRQGKLVCYPTDTVYGVGAAAGDDGAVRRVFAAKGRPLHKPVPLLIADVEEGAQLAEVTVVGRRLMERFWPGGLTIVMRKAEGFRSLALAGREKIALRAPDHALVREIIRALGEPITGTSANRAGAPPPVSAAEAALQMADLASLVVDGGGCPSRVESTVIDITEDPPKILREGAVGQGEIEEALGRQVGA